MTLQMIAEPAWQRDLHQAPSPQALSATSEFVVVHERQTRVVCSREFDGSVYWDIDVERWLYDVEVIGERCFIAPQLGPLRCLDLRSGLEL